MPGQYTLADLASPATSKPAGQYSAADVAAEPPSAASRFISSVGAALNPLPAIREWWNRPAEISKGMGAAHIIRLLKAQGVGENDPRMVQAVEQGLGAQIGQGPNAAALPLGTEPAVAAGGQGMRGDIAGAAGTLVGGYGVPAAVGVGLSKLNAARPGLATTLRESAEKQVGQVLNPTKIGNKVRAERLAPEMIQRRITAFSLKGLNEQATAGMERAGRALNEAYEHLPEGASVPLEDIKGTISRAAEEAFTVPDANGEPISISKVSDAGLNHAAEITSRLDLVAKVNPETGLKEIPVSTARRLRQYFDKVAKDSGRYDGKQLADQSAGEVHGVAADAIREKLNAIGTGDATIGDLNKEFQFWRDLGQVTGDTILRREGQAKPLGRKLAGAAGTAAGFATGGVKGALAGKQVMDMIERATTSPGWGTVSAVLKDRLADAIAKGEPGRITFYATRAEREAADNTGTGGARVSPVVTQPADGGTIPVDAATSSAPSGVEAGTGGPGASVQGSASAVAGSGAETSVAIPGESQGLAANYAIRELSDVQPSHSGLNFQPNPKYSLVNDRDYTKADNQGKVLTGALPKRFDPRFHITDNPDATNGPIVIDSQGNALGGNGRAMILQRVYQSNPEGVAAYRKLLTEKAAQFGLDPEQIKGMKQPVLVRQIAGHVEDPQAAITDLNKTGTAALRPAERIIADSKRVSAATLEDIGARLEAGGPDATLAGVLRGKSGAEILNKLIDDGVISSQERAGLATGDELTAAGQQRISKLMVGRFFDDPAQLEAIAPAVRNKLERIAAPLAKIEGAGDWSLTPAISKAVDLLEEARAHGGPLDDFLKQRALLSTRKYPAQSIAMAKALQSMTGKELLAAVKQYAEDAQFASGGENLFGSTPTPGQSFEVFQKKAAEKPQKGL